MNLLVDNTEIPLERFDRFGDDYILSNLPDGTPLALLNKLPQDTITVTMTVRELEVYFIHKGTK